MKVKVRKYKKNRKVFRPGEVTMLINTVAQTIQRRPISLISILRVCVRAGQLSTMGVDAAQVLKKELYRRAYNYEG